MIRIITLIRIKHLGIFAALAIGAAGSLAPAQENRAVDAAQLRPRAELASPAKFVQPIGSHKLVVKFRDAAQMRVSNTGLISRTAFDTTAIDDLLEQHRAQLEPLIKLSQQSLAIIEQRAAARSGNAQPDLAGVMRVRADDKDLIHLARGLRALDDIVEYVQFVAVRVPPACEDITPTTINFQNRQTYITRNPGLHADCAQLLSGATGEGIVIADVEYGVRFNHEDLCNIILEPGQTIHPSVFNLGWADHGTAVAGMIVSLDNNYGCTGIARDVTYSFFSEWTVEEGSRRESAIAAAINSLSPGDVLLLEMQAFGPNNEFVPAEYELAVWTLTRTAVDSGIIVVAAAGNGNRNLDSSIYDEYTGRGDSGAIIVGAGSPNTDHARSSFSNSGSRVNVQGWGSQVFTLGYGSFVQYNNDPNQAYTHLFSGTSSASAMIAGVVAALQSVSVQHFNTRLTPEQMRTLLIDTGRPQGGNTTRHIGPFPYMSRAAIALGIDVDDCNGNGNPNICRLELYGNADVNNNNVPDNCDRRGDLDGDGRVAVFDLLILLTQWGSCAPGCATQCSADQLVPDCVVDSHDLELLLNNWDL